MNTHCLSDWLSQDSTQSVIRRGLQKLKVEANTEQSECKTEAKNKEQKTKWKQNKAEQNTVKEVESRTAVAAAGQQLLEKRKRKEKRQLYTDIILPFQALSSAAVHGCHFCQFFRYFDTHFHFHWWALFCPHSLSDCTQRAAEIKSEVSKATTTATKTSNEPPFLKPNLQAQSIIP